MQIACHLLLGLGAACTCAPDLPSLPPGWVWLEVGDRPLRAYVPPVARGADPAQGPRPLVVALHGNNGTAEDFARATQLPELADQEGALVLFPQGAGRERPSWHAGPGCCGEAGEQALDDVAYLDAALGAARRRWSVDRVLGVGFSNGGMMLQRWVCEGEQVPDALVVAAAPVLIPACARARPTPLRVYAGTADERIPLLGGQGDRANRSYPSLRETLAFWWGVNGCERRGERATVGDTTCEALRCGAPLVACVVEGFGHAWPGGRNAPNTQAGATLAGWRWFLEL
jgi:polyhydroxybutyrate depolymerase